MATFRLSPSSSGTTTSALTAGDVATQAIYMDRYVNGYRTYTLIVTPGQKWPTTLPDEGTAGNNPDPTQPTVSEATVEIGTVKLEDGSTTQKATVNTNGSLKTTPGDGTTDISVSTVGADATSNTQNFLRSSAHLKGYNGTTWDRLRTGIFGAVSSVLGYLNVIPVGRYNASAPTLTDGQFINPQMDVNGNIKVTAATLQAGENQTFNRMMIMDSYSYQNITTATTTTVKSGAGILKGIIVNTTAAGTIAIWDNTAASGTKIGTLKSSVVEGSYMYNCSFATGITIVTGATSDITVIYL